MSSAAAEPQTMTVFEWQAQLIENASDNLAFWVDKTRDDKFKWAPAMEGSVNTRSPMQLAAECATVNRSMAAMFRGEQPTGGEMPEYDSKQACGDDLRASAKELGNAIRGLDAGALERIYETPFGPMPGAVLLQIALGNLQYHGGQVNLIQLLYGDPKFYIPGRD